jgi:hypothetical protein
MVERRHMLGHGLVAGLTGVLAAPALADAAPAAAEDTSEAAARAVDRLGTTIEREVTPATASPAIARIREQQRTFIRANLKYPDYLEVGLSVWEQVYDWHVKFQQPVTAARLADGRYVLAFMFTNLILRPDQAPEYVGFGFDTEPVRRVNE